MDIGGYWKTYNVDREAIQNCATTGMLLTNFGECYIISCLLKCLKEDAYGAIRKMQSAAMKRD